MRRLSHRPQVELRGKLMIKMDRKEIFKIVNNLSYCAYVSFRIRPLRCMLVDSE